MKIRGNVVGTTLKPKAALLKCEDLTAAEKAKIHKNLGITGEGGGSSGDGGGDAAALMVTVDGAKASHTATDIFNHAAAGGVVLLNHYGSYFMLAHCSAETACFVYTADDAVDTVFIITEQGDVEETEISYATANVLNGIDAALDAIIAIQNALIGGETV